MGDTSATRFPASLRLRTSVRPTQSPTSTTPAGTAMAVMRRQLSSTQWPSRKTQYHAGHSLAQLPSSARYPAHSHSPLLPSVACTRARPANAFRVSRALVHAPLLVRSHIPPESVFGALREGEQTSGLGYLLPVIRVFYVDPQVVPVKRLWERQARDRVAVNINVQVLLWRTAAHGSLD